MQDAHGVEVAVVAAVVAVLAALSNHLEFLQSYPRLLPVSLSLAGLLYYYYYYYYARRTRPRGVDGYGPARGCIACGGSGHSHRACVLLGAALHHR